MTPPSLWQRIRNARIVQVLGVYLGACWVVVQIADTLTDALSLPAWVTPAAVVLLLVGLVIIVSTAWVQSLASTTAAEEAGQRPTDWEIAPGDAVARLREGQLPHLTWGRAILAGVVALSLLFGGTGVYVGLTGRSERGVLGPSAAGASEAADGIAVLPFVVSGVADGSFWGTGMVDLLATNLDGMGGYRAIDSRTVMARWRERVGDQGSPDLRTSLEAAALTGARYALVGSAVGVGPEIRLVAEIYDLSDGMEIGSGQVQGTSDDPLALVDGLSLEAMRQLLSGSDERLATTRSVSEVTTASVAALRAYLEGERYYREALFSRAAEAYERALAADSTFVLAMVRLAEAYGWTEGSTSDRAVAWAERAALHLDRLSPRNALLVRANTEIYQEDMRAVPLLREAVRRYPDDPEAWFLLAEVYLHMGEATGGRLEDALAAVTRAMELDPGFAPYYLHAVDLNMAVGSPEEARRLLDRYLAFPGTQLQEELYLAAWDLYFGPDADAARAWDRVRALDDASLSIVWSTFGIMARDLGRSQDLADLVYARSPSSGTAWLVAHYAMAAGQLDRAETALRTLDFGAQPAFPLYIVHRFGRPVPADLLERVRSCAPEPGTNCAFPRGALAADEGNWDDFQRMLEAAREEEAAMLATGDSIEARFLESKAVALEGYGALRRGRLQEARTLLEGGQGRSFGIGDQMARIWLAETHEALGNAQEAIRWYGLQQTTPLRSYALERRARLLEESGELDAARKDWELLAVTLGSADPGHPGAAAAREALARLGTGSATVP